MFDTPYVSVSTFLVDAMIYAQQRNGLTDRPPNRIRTGIVPKEEAITILCSHAPPGLAAVCARDAFGSTEGAFGDIDIKGYASMECVMGTLRQCCRQRFRFLDNAYKSSSSNNETALPQTFPSPHCPPPVPLHHPRRPLRVSIAVT